MLPMEPSSVSSQNVDASTLSLFTTSAYDVLKSHPTTVEPPPKKQPEKHRFGLSRVKNATKCAAKKFNQIFSKAKLRLIKPSLKYSGDISIMSSTTQMTDMDASYEFEEIDINDISRFSSRTTILIDESDQQYSDTNRLSNCSFDSTIGSCTSVESVSSASVISLNESSLMHQIFAQSIADLNMICAHNETPVPKTIETKKPIRKGTPYKLKMPQRLTLYEECVRPIKFDGNDSIEMLSSTNDKLNPCNVDAIDINVKKQLKEIPIEKCIENKVEPQDKARLKLHFNPVKPKASIAKQIAQTYREFYTKFLSKPMKYEILQSKPMQIDPNLKMQLHKNWRTKFGLIFGQ